MSAAKLYGTLRGLGAHDFLCSVGSLQRCRVLIVAYSSALQILLLSARTRHDYFTYNASSKSVSVSEGTWHRTRVLRLTAERKQHVAGDTSSAANR